MKNRLICCLIILAVAVLAFIARIPRLSQRPMHTDEAVHAQKFGSLLEQNDYRYDPTEYHGPTLNYFTLIGAKLAGIEKYTDLTETLLRIVPVFFSVVLILMLLLLTDALPPRALILAAVFTAVSPAFTYYSRYYIQEMLLVCFTFGVIVCAYRYTKKQNVLWALMTGVFLGLAHATKETFIIALASMFLAFLLLDFRKNLTSGKLLKAVKPLHIFIAIAAALIVSAMFYSSFLTNPAGIIDSFKTYATYFTRASQSELHIHPWYFYIKMLLYWRVIFGPLWTEAVIVILACLGLAIALARKGLTNANASLLRFIAFYTLIMTVIYSAIPYKTPWSMLGLLYGMILLAGFAFAEIIERIQNRYSAENETLSMLLRAKSMSLQARRSNISLENDIENEDCRRLRCHNDRLFCFLRDENRLLKNSVISLLIIGCAHLAWQSYRSAYRYYSDPVNPYVYAHTSIDVLNLTDRIRAVSKAHPDGRDMYIQVICRDSDYWPLPWYLRDFPNIAWQDTVKPNIPAAELIIASPPVMRELMHKLYELAPPGQRHLYVPLFDFSTDLRPNVKLIPLIKKDLLDRSLRPKNQND